MNTTNPNPILNLDAKKGLIEIRGKSIPTKDAPDFFKPVFNWLDNYLKAPSDITTVNIQLELFTTGTSACIMDILKRLEVLHNTNKVVVNWYYEENDEDILETGESYRNIIKIPFNLIKIKEK